MATANPATADDAAYAIFELEGGIIAQMNSTWCARVDRDELLTLQVDGRHGSAVAGLHSCKVQHRVNTPRPVWNPDMPRLCYLAISGNLMEISADTEH
jgi:predicted dehydrogenase